MAKEKIPYIFDTPIPSYFRLNGWFTPRKDGRHIKIMNFLIWSFSRCSCQKRTVFHDHKSIALEPYEFIFGINKCSEETGLSVQEIKTIINQLFSTPNGSLLEKTTNSVTNRFTCYMWVTRHFSENSNQHINQPPTNRQPTANYNLEERRENKEEEHKHGLRAVGCDVSFPFEKSHESKEPKRIVITRSNEDHNEDRRDEDSPNPKKSSEDEKKSFGKEKNVKLTQVEYDDLINYMTENERNYWIDQVRLEIGKKGEEIFSKKYRNHYHTILSWHQWRKDNSKITPLLIKESPEDNRKIAQEFKNQYRSKNYVIEVLSKAVEFTPLSGQSVPDIVLYNSHGFRQQIENLIMKRNFEKIRFEKIEG